MFEALASMFVEELSAEHGAPFESILEPYVRAAEQLGEDATVPQIVSLAKDLALRKI